MIVIVLVCGGRSFADRELMRKTLDTLHAEHRIDLIVHGDAGGADRLAGAWARATGVREHRHPANWERHGRAAGPIRNAHMLEAERPDLVVAFEGGRGTADMVRRSQAAGVRVIEVR